MKRSEKIFKELKKNRLIALLTPKNPEECLTAYEIFRSSGVILEIALRSKYALDGIKAVLAKHPDALILAGTVMTGEQADSAVRAGVSGIVSADYIPEIVDICVNSDIMCVPGGLSDAGKQLVRKAEKYGCSLEDLKNKYPYQWIYKLFPAFAGDQSHINLPDAWKGPFKGLTVVYTGGISFETLIQAAKKDPNGIFCGSALAKNPDDPREMKKEIHRWRSVLFPSPPLKVEESGKSPAPSTGVPGVVTFGELMIRLSPPQGVRLKNAGIFDVNFGGAEANVAVSLAQFGLNSCFVSALPSNDLGDNACGVLRRYGVDTRFILRRGKRMGIYFLEHGSGPRPSKVVYDRAFSSASEIKPGEVDWDEVFKEVHWFHWTGITPALSDSTAEALLEGLKSARKKGITISTDLNYRKKLWDEKKARTVMSGLMPYVDILFGNEEDPTRVFGIQPKGTDVVTGKLNIEGYEELTRILVDMFGFKKAAISLRKSISASENSWSACLFNGEQFIKGPEHHVWILDRVGTGDAFASGLIYSLISGKTDEEALSFGIAAACLKHSVLGDFNSVSLQEVEKFASGDTTGRVQR